MASMAGRFFLNDPERDHKGDLLSLSAIISEDFTSTFLASLLVMEDDYA